MNATNRALNRALLLVIGLVLLAGGAAVGALALWPAAAATWESFARSVRDGARRAAESTRIGDTTASWFVIGLAAAALVLAALLALSLVRLARRRTGTVIGPEQQRTELGRVTVTERFVADALGSAIRERDDVLSCSVSANEVTGSPVLHVSVTPRPRTDPRPILADLDRLLTNLAALTGQRTRTYVSLHAGLRARLTPETRHLD